MRFPIVNFGGKSTSTWGASQSSEENHKAPSFGSELSLPSFSFLHLIPEESEFSNHGDGDIDKGRPLLPLGDNLDEARQLPTSTLTALPSSTSFVKKYGELISLLLTLFAVIFVVIMSIYLAYESARVGQFEWTTFLSATPIVMATIPISIHEIIMHLQNYYMPDVQKYVVRILWMVPIYSIQSWLALRVQPSIMAYVEPFRDLYEAYALASFVYFLIDILGGEARLAQILKQKDAKYGQHAAHIKLLSCQQIKDWEMGEEFLTGVKKGVLSFIILKCLAAFLIVICKIGGVYGEGTIDTKHAFMYIAAILSLSLSWALNCLLKLFHATREELTCPKDWHPIGKFLCIKGVIFFTFWQGIAIAIIMSCANIHEIGSWDAHRIKKEAQDLLVVIEMFAFAIAHRYTFSHKEYMYRPVNITNNPDDSELGHCYDKNNSFFTHDSDDQEQAQKGQRMWSRQLSRPMNFLDAVKSSHIPKETYKDLKRFSKETVYSGKRENSISRSND